MGGPRIAPASALLDESQFLSTGPNNFRFNPEKFRCEFPILAEILKHHNLGYALTASPQVAAIYVQQFWHTLRYSCDDDEPSFEGYIDRLKITIMLDVFRDTLRLPTRSQFPGKTDFDEIPPDSIMLEDIRALGYAGPLTNTSQFKTNLLAPVWFALFSIINRCLTSKKTGMDNGSTAILRLFHGVAYNRHYDFADMIWDDLKDVVLAKNTMKARVFVPFQRFLQIIINDMLIQQRDISDRPADPRFPITEMKYLKAKGGARTVKSTPLPEELLAYARDARMVQQYRISVGLMVQPDPTGPSQGALHQSSEGLGLDELSEPEAEATPAHVSKDEPLARMLMGLSSLMDSTVVSTGNLGDHEVSSPESPFDTHVCRQEHVIDLTTKALKELLLSRLSCQSDLSSQDADIMEALQQALNHHPQLTTLESLNARMLADMQSLTDKYRVLASTCHKRPHQDQDPDERENKQRFSDSKIRS